MILEQLYTAIIVKAVLFQSLNQNIGNFTKPYPQDGLFLISNGQLHNIYMKYSIGQMQELNRTPQLKEKQSTN